MQDVAVSADDIFLRGSLQADFLSWEDQDIHVLHVLRRGTLKKPKQGDVLAIPATLNGVRQDGYYLGSLQTRKRRHWVDFYQPLSQSTFVLPDSHVDAGDSIPFCLDTAYIPIRNLIYTGDGKITLACTVDEHIKAFLSSTLAVAGDGICDRHGKYSRKRTSGLTTGVDVEAVDNLSELDSEKTDDDESTGQRNDGRVWPCKRRGRISFVSEAATATTALKNKRNKKIIIDDEENEFCFGGEDRQVHVHADATLEVPAMANFESDSVPTLAEPAMAKFESDAAPALAEPADPSRQLFYSPIRFLSLQQFEKFASSWDEVDSCIRSVNKRYANISSRGFVGFDVLAMPVQGPAAGSRGYLAVKFINYDPATECLAAMVLLPVTADGISYAQGYVHAFYGMTVENACVPLRASNDTRTGTVTLSTTLEAAIATHLSVEIFVSAETRRVGKCTYPAEKKKLDDNKARQNKAIYQAVRDIPCENAIVLDSVGYCTSSRLMAKGRVVKIVVPNNSEDCARMQQPPVGVMLLPGVTLLQEIQRWNVTEEGAIGCLVADTCRHFNDELRLALDAAFPKFADRAILSITVSTRGLVQGRVLKEIKAYIKARAKEHEFVNNTGARVRPVGLPVLYGSNMLFILYSFQKQRLELGSVDK